MNSTEFYPSAFRYFCGARVVAAARREFGSAWARREAAAQGRRHGPSLTKLPYGTQRVPRATASGQRCPPCRSRCLAARLFLQAPHCASDHPWLRRGRRLPAAVLGPDRHAGAAATASADSPPSPSCQLGQPSLVLAAAAAACPRAAAACNVATSSRSS